MPSRLWKCTKVVLFLLSQFFIRLLKVARKSATQLYHYGKFLLLLLRIPGGPANLWKILTVARCTPRHSLSMSTHETCRYASPQRAFVWVRLQLSNTEHSYWMGVCTTPSQRYMALLCHTLIPGPSNTAVSSHSTTWETRVKLQDLPSQRCTKGGLLVVVHLGCRQEGARCLWTI